VQAFPAMVIAAGAGRLIRRVVNLTADVEEIISPLEQIYLTIAVTDRDMRPGIVHKEMYPTTMLSILASLTPFSDFNQVTKNIQLIRWKCYGIDYLYFVYLLNFLSIYQYIYSQM
jgi:hypothetical protein